MGNSVSKETGYVMDDRASIASKKSISDFAPACRQARKFCPPSGVIYEPQSWPFNTKIRMGNLYLHSRYTPPWHSLTAGTVSTFLFVCNKIWWRYVGKLFAILQSLWYASKLLIGIWADILDKKTILTFSGTIIMTNAVTLYLKRFNTNRFCKSTRLIDVQTE